MAGPFPGMDPYLEDRLHWTSFHKQLVAALHQVLLPGLVDKYRAKVGVREYVSETPLFTSILRENHSEEYLEIRTRSDGKLVSLVEVVSLGNRTTTAGRASYLAVRDEAHKQKSAIVEIDLLTQGKPLLDYARDNLPEHDHTVTVTRAATPERYEIYTATLAKRLPKFRLPLAAEDKDNVLDLQTVLARAYDGGNFAKLLDYAAPLPPDAIYTDATKAWIAATLIQAGHKRS